MTVASTIKTMIMANIALARIINYGCKVANCSVSYGCNYVPFNRKTFIVEATGVNTSWLEHILSWLLGWHHYKKDFFLIIVAAH
jgi:hypothetical protein